MTTTRSKREDYASRKFLLACLFSGAGTAAMFGGLMDGPTYVALATLVLGTYGASNVMEKRAATPGQP
jgi:hypothetical protein